MSRWIPRVALVALATAWTVGAAAHGPDGEHPHYTVIAFEKIDPSGFLAYEQAARSWVDTFAGADGDLQWFTSFGPNYTYGYLMTIHSYADLDGLEAQFGAVLAAQPAEKQAELMAGVPHVERRWRELLKERPDLSYLPSQPSGAPGVVHVLSVSVKPEREQQFEALLKKVAAAYAKAEHPHSFQIHKVEFGEGSYVVVNTGETKAELYGRPDAPEILTGAVGAEQAQALLTEWLDCVSGFEISDWTPRVDLSLMPAPAGSEAEGE